MNSGQLLALSGPSLLDPKQRVVDVLEDDMRPKTRFGTLSKPVLREGDELFIVHSDGTSCVLDSVDERKHFTARHLAAQFRLSNFSKSGIAL